MRKAVKPSVGRKDVGWCMIPPWVVGDPELKLADKVVCGRVWALANSQGYCYASNRWLGEQLDLAPGTVSNCLSNLAARGFIRVEIKRNLKNEITSRHVYPIHSPVDTSPSLDGDLSIPQWKEVEEKVSTKREDKTYPAEFEEFWEAYPRKIAKAAAYRKWKALVTRNGQGPNAETIARAAQHYREACQVAGTEETYMMHAATFLGPQRRWEDYLEPPKVPAKGQRAIAGNVPPPEEDLAKFVREQYGRPWEGSQ